MLFQDFKLDKKSKVKLYYQLYTYIVDCIKNKTVPLKTKIPSIRELTAMLETSKNTVTRAYAELEKDGYIYSVSKSGFFTKNPDDPIDEIKESVPLVEDDIPTVESILKQHNKENKEKSVPPAVNLSAPLMSTDTYISKDAFSATPENTLKISDLMDSSLSESKVITDDGIVVSRDNNFKMDKQNELSFELDLLESYKTVLSEQSNNLNVNSPCFGISNLKIALASFLYEFHRVDVNPNNIVIGANTDLLICNLLCLPSLRHPNTKNPGEGLLSLAEQAQERNYSSISPSLGVIESNYSSLNKILKHTPIPLEPLAADSEGIIPDCLFTSGITTLFTHSTTYPSNREDDFFVEDRHEVIKEWLDSRPYRYLIEFDDTTEVSPIKLFKSDDDQEKVIYLSSLKKLLCPGINFSFLVLPNKLMAEYTKLYSDLECTISHLDQLAFTDFFIKGKVLHYLKNIEKL